MWELAALAKHCHPTICYWAEELLKGELIEYPGDPLLDFGLSNFLDRIAFKNPKSDEKIAKFRSRMAAFEKPVNEYDFQNGDEPEHKREEEAYLYKYMQMRPEKKKADKLEQDPDESEDPNLEAFAEKMVE